MMSDLLSSYQSGMLGQKVGRSSQSTCYLEELQRRVPVVGDKGLIDLVNGIQVSKDLIRYRKNRGFFGQLIDTLDGSRSQTPTPPRWQPNRRTRSTASVGTRTE
jgi:hypothetical protein